MNIKYDNKEEKFAKREKFQKNEKRILIKSDGKVSSIAIRGRVIGTKGKSYFVEDLDNISNVYECKKSGMMISEGNNLNILAIGDIVWFIPESSNNKVRDLKGTINKVENRRSWLSRTAVYSPNEHIIASNIDYLIIFMSAINPIYNRRLIDRFIVSAELGNIKPVICINKIDLIDNIDNIEIKEDFDTYIKLGINVFFISALYHKGISEFASFLKDNCSVLAGPSGTGKSTVLNALMKEEIQSVGDISNKTFKGKHTTSNIHIFRLPNNGELIDTPGIREFAIWGIDKEELALYFHDFDNYREKCKYNLCTHIHEPDCAIKDAVEKGEIDFQRYESYVNMYDTLE